MENENQLEYLVYWGQGKQLLVVFIPEFSAFAQVNENP